LVAEYKITYDDKKEVMREMQEALNAANRALAENRDPEAISQLQLNQFAAQDNFDLAEQEALNAEYFW
jgi:hypothetical protein